MILSMLNCSQSISARKKDNFASINDKVDNIVISEDEYFGPPSESKMAKYNDKNHSVIEIRRQLLQDELGEDGDMDRGILCQLTRCTSYRDLSKRCEEKYEDCDDCSNKKRRYRLCKLQFAVDILDKEITFHDMSGKTEMV